MVLSGGGYNAGVVGIVCSRLVERFGRPCIVIADDGAEAKGSGRSVEGFSLIEAVRACSERLTRFGGHPMAAGFSLASGDIADFADRLERFAASHYQEMPPVRLKIDCAVSPAQMTLDEAKGLSALEPFGCGNEPRCSP
jgi:single-stranded-DNA-specific exonuclease